ncbi:MAG: UvrD-helicase domain-containing protein, partial [Chitinophagaceae bacterium]
MSAAIYSKPHTQEQLKIFDFIKYGEKHGIIDAVAGSGKTTTIIDCADHINGDSLVMFCAFNNSIANEIRKRFAIKGKQRVHVKTIHALGFDILKTNTANTYKLDIKKYDKIIEAGLRQGVFDEEIEELLEINKIKARAANRFEESLLRNFRNSFKHILIDLSGKFRLTLTKSDLTAVKELITHYNILNEKKTEQSTFDAETKVYYKINEKIIEKGNQISDALLEIDFSDMLYLPYIKKLSPIHKYDFLFIDECQDLSR